MATLTSSWWEFDGTTDYLYREDLSADFAPAGDCTVLAIVEAADPLVSGRYIFSKYADYGTGIYNNQKSWWIYQTGDDGQCYISADGFAISGRTNYNHVVIDTPYMIAMTYKYVGAANSEMQLWHIDDSGSYSSSYYYAAKGPVFPGAGQVSIGAFFSSEIPTSYYFGKIYCVAYYDGLFATQQNLEDIWDGTAGPWDFNPKVYVDFSKEVASTYTSEIGDYVFNVGGSPTHGGSYEPSYPFSGTSILGHEFSVSMPVPMTGNLSHRFSVVTPVRMPSLKPFDKRRLKG